MKNCNEDFTHCTGTERLHKAGVSGRINATDGVVEIAEATKSFWLIDLITSHQIYESVKMTPFQVWRLNRTKGNQFVIVCEDGNSNEVTSQKIPFSDFKYDEYTLWLTNGVLMLPSEY